MSHVAYLVPSAVDLDVDLNLISALAAHGPAENYTYFFIFLTSFYISPTVLPPTPPPNG